MKIPTRMPVMASVTVIGRMKAPDLSGDASRADWK